MDATLQKHGAKHIYKVPEGLRELCTDITREVLRSQPREIYSFIADYIDVLLITRENAKVAVKVINNILKGSHTIMNILCHTGLTIEQIAAAAPRIQKAFRMYLDIIDGQRPDEDERFDETSKISLRDILEKTGFDMDQANKAATIIQTAFRGHYTKMRVAESQGKVQWQRALINTLNILKKAGVPQEEIIKSLPTIQVAYRGYYTNKNIRMKMDADQEISKEEEKTHEPIVDPRETVQAVAWLEMIYEDSISSFEIMDEAARVIQRAYKRHRTRRTSVFSIQKVISSRSFVVEGILDILRQSAFDKIISRDDIPKELGTREDLKKAMELLKQIYKDRLRDAKVPTEEKYEEEMETVPADAEKLDEMVEEEKMAKPSGTEDEEILVEDLTGEPIEVVEEQAERDKREEQEIEEEVEQEIEQEVEQEEEQERKIEEEEEVQQEKEEKEEEEEEVQQEKEEKEEEEEEQEKEEEREEQEEEQEMPHEATSANDTAG